MENHIRHSVGNLWCGIAALMLFMGITSCSNEDSPKPEFPEGPSEPVEPTLERARTVLVYMIGDVNLWQEQWTNLNRLEAGWGDDIDGNLLVYLDPSPHTTQFPHPVLLEVMPDKTDAIVSRVVKNYPDQDAADKTVMRGVLEDALRLYPAKSQGLVIASHGTGWWPVFADDLVPPDEEDEHESGADDPSVSEVKPAAGVQSLAAPGLPKTRSIAGGDRFDSAIEIEELAETLPVKYDFILMHACLMGNVETAYALKDKCSVYVASPQPLPGVSLPFQTLTRYLFAQPAADFLGVLRQCANFYYSLPDDQFDMLTLSVIRTDGLDKLAAATRALMVKLTADPAAFYARLDEQLYRFEGSLYQDLKQLIELEAATDPQLEQEYRAFIVALAETVLLTTNIYRTLKPGTLLTPDEYCGLTCYTPLPETEFTQLNDYYKTHYKWGDASGFGLLVGYLAPEEENRFF